jgi:hypothetical protein
MTFHVNSQRRQPMVLIEHVVATIGFAGALVSAIGYLFP